MLDGINLIGDKITTVLDRINSYFPRFNNFLSNISYYLNDILTYISDWSYNWILPDYPTDDIFSNPFYYISEQIRYITDYIDSLIELQQQKENTESFTTNFSNIITDENTIFGASAKLSNDINDVITNIDGTNASNITVSYGGKLVGKDLSNKVVISNEFYTPYKQKGDLIISSFLWLNFIFQFFSQLGKIMAGGGFRIIKRDNNPPEIQWTHTTYVGKGKE